MNILYMQEALKLARKGEGKVGDNPLVGAVIVKDGKIISRGYHGQTGKDHAEVEAFKNAKEDVKGASLYVTLEPCCHYGKTPPCTKLIIKKGIKKVYIATKDVNKKVSGKGIEELKKSGIEVQVGLMEEEAQKINEVFIKNQLENKVFLAMKYAMSMDGKIATKTSDSKWITGEEARLHVHKLRNKYRGIMIGVETALKDNPRLTCRLEDGRNPIRIILDSKLRIHSELKILKNQNIAKTIIVTTENSDFKKLDQLKNMGVDIIVAKSMHSRVDMEDALEKLYSLGINSILLEGGGSVNYSALKAGLVDKVYTYIAPKFIGGVDAKTPVEGEGIDRLIDSFNYEIISNNLLGNDILIEAKKRGD